MHNLHLICRCHHLGTVGKRAGASRRPFATQKAEPRYAPDLPFRAEHLKLDVTVDPIGKTLAGHASYRLRVVSTEARCIELDQVSLQISAVSLGNHAAEFRKENQKLLVQIPSALGALKEGQLIELKIEYRVQEPKRGLYFTGPEEHFPRKVHQVWSQGQDQDNHYWFPGFDYPNQRMTVEMIARVPEGYTAVSNGALQPSKAKNQFHYKMDEPIVIYLVSLAVGQFAAWKDKGPGGLSVEYYVAPGREADGKRAFSGTPKMIEAFVSKIGVPYPYAKYSQVAVQDFIFGGMENASATTQTDLTLHDERAHLDFSSDPLVSHELAHQWFGDLLTCRDWSHAWLNEGFATFMERVWIECNPGPDGGPDEAKFYSYLDLKEYLEEDSDQYRRPIVCNVYEEPTDIFDRHLYQKGGLVLNLLRHVLGEEHFWRSIRLYVTRHRNQAVETIDLIRAIEDATGRNLRRFFDEWVFSAGHPEFEVTYAWQEERKLAELVIEQKQTQGKPSMAENGVTTHLFHLPVTVEFQCEDGSVVRHVVDLQQARERVLLAVPSAPKMARFDPEAAIPKTLKFTRPREMALFQLQNDSDCQGRIDAAHELAKSPDLEIVAALEKVVLNDKFWGVQAEAAEALSRIRLDAARDALISCLSKVQHPKSRKSVAHALRTFKDAKSAQALRAVAEKDASYFVEAQASSSFAEVCLAGFLSAESPEVDRLETFLLSQLKKDSYREVIRKAAFGALARLPGIESGKRPKAFEALIQGAGPGTSPDHRGGAIGALGKLAAKATPSVVSRVFRVFSDLAEERSYFIRSLLVGAIEDSNQPEGIPLLRKLQDTETDGRIKRHAVWAVDSIQEGMTSPAALGQLRKDLEQLQTEYQKMRTLVEDLGASEKKKAAPKPASG